MTAAARRLKAPKTLRRFERSNARVRCVKGPVGSGKSSDCVLEIPRRASRQRPGPDGVRRSRFVIIRNTYSQLRDTTRKTFEQWIPPELGSWNEQAFTWVGEWFLDDEKTDRVHCEVLFRPLDRPEDVRKLLSLELTGAYINEAREIAKHILDVLDTRIGRYPAKADGGASWSGIWMDTNPWHGGHWGAKLFAKLGPAEGYELFCQPGGRSPEAENVKNLDRCWDSLWLDADQDDEAAVIAGREEQDKRIDAGKHEAPCRCYYPRLCVGKSAEYVKVYVDGEDADSDVGAIWGAWMAALHARGAVCAFDHAMDRIYTSWDLGRADSTAIWFWRLGANGLPQILDHYENAGQGLSHFFGVVDGKGYAYAKHLLPHDSKIKTLATQRSVIEQCVDHWGLDKVARTPDLSVEDGIEAARWLLEQPIEIHERCDVPARLEHSGLEALREYRYEWDEENQCFKRTPLHNWASHSADAFRYLACAVKAAQLDQPPKHEPKGPYALPVDSRPTIDEAWADYDREQSR